MTNPIADIVHPFERPRTLSIGLLAALWQGCERHARLEVVRRGGAGAVAGRGIDAERAVLEVVPGRSIGPVHLGMDRSAYAVVEGRAPLVEPRFEGGRCREIRASLPLTCGEPPFFRLAGRFMNGLRLHEVHDVLKALPGAVEIDDLSGDVPALGLSFWKWESGDGFYTFVSVSDPATAPRRG